MSKQQKVGYFICKSWLHLCPTQSISDYVSAWHLSAARAGQFKKRCLTLRKCTDPHCDFHPRRRVRLCLVGGSWWRVSPPAEMKWSTRHYKHSAAARAGSERCQKLRDGITEEKKVSEKEEKLLSSALTPLSRPGSGELAKLKPNWKKAREQRTDPPVWRRGVLQQGKKYLSFHMRFRYQFRVDYMTYKCRCYDCCYSKKFSKCTIIFSNCLACICLASETTYGT